MLAHTLAALLALSQPARPVPEAVIRWEPYVLRTGGHELTAELGRLAVPERHDRPAGRTIDIAFVRLRSTAETPGPPVVYLDGGPGDSGVGTLQIPEYREMFTALRARADVIVLSQRGTGLSRPYVGCPTSGPLPDDLFASVQRMRAVLDPRLTSCASALRAEGVDPSAYTTEASADDVELLRRALGADRVSLLAFSYGTHLALSIARRHETAVDRVVLIGTEGPDHTLKLPQTYDLQIQKIGALVSRDPETASWMPDFTVAVRRLTEETRGRPLHVPVGGADPPRTLTIGEAGLQYLLRRDIGDTNDVPAIPGLIADVLAGRYEGLARLATRRLQQLESVNLMGVSMDCASGASPERLAQIAREEPASLLGVMVNAPFPDICATLGLPLLPADYRAPVFSTVPTLFVSGTLDSNTPPYQAEQVRWGFPAGRHLIVENAGHESMVSHPAARRAVEEFLSGRDIDVTPLVLPPPKFRAPRGR